MRQAFHWGYSGTGNSLKVLEWADARCQARGISSRVALLDAVEPADGPSSPNDLLVLAFPTHGFTAPWPILRFITRTLHRGGGARAVVMATRGSFLVRGYKAPGLAGTAPALVALLLWLRGFRVRVADSVDMPINWTSAVPAADPVTYEAIEARAKSKVDHVVDDTLDGKLWLPTVNAVLDLLFGLALVPLSFAYTLVGRRVFAAMMVAGARCDGCGLCVKSCPHGAIEARGDVVRGKRRAPVWSDACESCMRCLNFCPREAVESSWLAAVILSAALFGVWHGLVTGAGIETLVPEGWPTTLAMLLVGALAAAVVVPAFLALTRYRWVRVALAQVTPTRFYRRYRPREMRLVQLMSRRR